MTHEKFLRNMTLRFAIAIALSLAILNCENRNNKDQEAKSTLLSFAVSGSAPASVTNACRWAVSVLNTCIADGYGFNPATMCHQEVTKYFTEANYNTLSDCALKFKAQSSCHLNQNKFPNAQSAFSNGSFITAGVSGTTSFNSCNQTATTTDGQTINIMVY